MGKIGKSQMEKFRTLYLRDDGTSMVSIAPNYRETQNNINNVYECMNPPIIDGNRQANVSLEPLSTVEWVIIAGMVAAIAILSIWSVFKLRQVHGSNDTSPANKRVTSNSR